MREEKKRVLKICFFIFFFCPSGLEELQEVYDLFPNALLCLKFITEVAKIILADFCPEHRSLESDPLPEAAEQRRDKVNFVSGKFIVV